MALRDYRGDLITGATASALESFEQGLAAFQSWRGDPARSVETALEEAPGFVMAHVLRAYLLVCTREPAGVLAAAPISENAAKLYGLYPKKGAIALGADADVVVIDPEKEATLGVARMRSRADYSLWEGRKVKGVPVMTFLRGRLGMENGEIVGQVPTGKFVEQVIKPRRL